MEKTDIDTTARLKEVVRLVSYGRQADFARLCGIPTASLSRLLSGEYRMTENYIRKICAKVAELNPDYLRGLSDDPGIVDVHRTREDELRELRKEVAELREQVKVFKWLIKKAMIEEGEDLG